MPRGDARLTSVSPMLEGLAISGVASSIVGYIGHRVHVVRRREAAWLLTALGDVRDQTVLDVAGGDGYWASQLAKRGAFAVGVDLAMAKLRRGRTLPDPPALIRGDALRMPVPDASVDALVSMCAIEHFPDAATAFAEMARVARPGSLLTLSADTLSDEAHWPKLADGHRKAFAVVETFDRDKLTKLLEDAGFDVLRSEYMFKRRWAQGLYLRLHRWRYAPNALAPLGPLVALSDRRTTAPGGAIVFVQARRR
jgi:SAM-dependent methyltransferase